jgi:phage I-like protein
MTKQKPDGAVTRDVDKYVSGLSLEGARKPLASMARLLAESLELAPPYARSNLARQLRELLTDLAAEEHRVAEWAERQAEREARRAEDERRRAEMAPQLAEIEEMAARRGTGVG